MLFKQHGAQEELFKFLKADMLQFHLKILN